MICFIYLWILLFRCPLYSTNDDIHVDPVREEAKKAKKDVETGNPQLKLKHDPTKILPKETGSHHAHHNLHHMHYQYNPGFNHYLEIHYPIFHEPPAGIQMVDRLNRARQGIQMAVRMVAGGVNVPFADNRGHHQQPQQGVPNQNPFPPANQN